MGDVISVAPDPLAPRAKTEDKQEIFNKANSADVSILADADVAVLKASDERTPLHWLAIRKAVDILDKTEADKVVDGEGETPLHLLADQGMAEVLRHPSVGKVKGYCDWTPLRRLADSISEKDVAALVEYLKASKDEEGNMDVLKVRGLV
jgi:hypothetical protein